MVVPSKGGANGGREGATAPLLALEFVYNSIILEFDVRKPKLPLYTYQKACYFKRKKKSNGRFVKIHIELRNIGLGSSYT